MLLFYCFGNNSNCYAAAVTQSMLSTINERTNKVFEYFGYTYRNKFNSTYGIGYNPNINKMCIGITSEDSPYRPNTLFVFYPDNNPMGILSTNKYNTWFFGIVNLNNGGYSSISGGDIPITTKWKYIYTEFAWQSSTGYSFSAGEEYGGYVFTSPPFKVTSIFEDISVDNVTNKAFRLDYNQAFTKIGHIEDISDDSHFVNITFSQVGGSFLIRDTLNLYNMFNSNEDFYIDENYDIFIRNRLLTYNTKYLLTADTFSDSTFTTQTGNYELNYYTITTNAVINGGIITSLGSGDYSIQNSVNDTIDFYNDDTLVNSEIDSFFSGDTAAIVSNLNFPNLENNYFVVIYNVVSGISDTLQMSGDPYFDVSLHGETPKRIYASDFTTPPSVLKTFISMALIFGTLYILYLQLSGFIMLINTGHVKDAINQIDDVSGATLYKM